MLVIYQKIKAEQYLKDVMNRYRNKLVYDASTGEIRDDRNHMSMLEDFWTSTVEKVVEEQRLQHFRVVKILERLMISFTFNENYLVHLMSLSQDLKQSQGFSLGRTTEITSDELKFTKFVQRIRKKFVPLFTDILKTNLLLKGVISPDDWTPACKSIFSMIS